MIALYVRFVLKDEAAAVGFDELVARTTPLIEAREPGTLQYVVHLVADAPLSRAFYEVYADQAAFSAHERQPHVKQFMAERQQYLASYQVDFLAPAGGKGLPR
ncbi:MULTISPECIES: putative quinol monooxygenase [Amycolatopsis]|uniref:putative quinol monooxygenase n=1 Tax=Amycolatopsis TaxID=1813 RepID=UPI001C59856A|nr:antibiotic biosynthesis monooxygenase [Amycolatopsis sp. TNS106]QXV56580.1 antibiotic biosynthesis monooxygenase [Amycolatopsis sp. TNS106]